MSLESELTLVSNPVIEMAYPAELKQQRCQAWAEAVRSSYRSLLVRSLSDVVEAAPLNDLPATLFDSPFALLAHGTEPDPIFCFANRVALELFGYDWESFTCLPSRFSAEPENRERRRALLDQATQKGFISDYAGIRIAADGRRFQVSGVTVWNVTDPSGHHLGQAARIDEWKDL